MTTKTYDEMIAVMQAARDGKQIEWKYKCAKCKKHYKAKEVSVDHIETAGSLNTFDDIGPFVKRLFCGTDGLQVLCKDCHTTKTASERRTK